MITFTSTTKTMWEIRTLILGFYFKSFMANILSVFLTTVIDQYYLVDKTYYSLEVFQDTLYKPNLWNSFACFCINYLFYAF